MKNNGTLIAVVVIFAIIVLGALYAFTVWQKEKNKAGHVDQDGIMGVITSPFSWFNENYGVALVANGRNDKVANAMYNTGTSATSFKF